MLPLLQLHPLSLHSYHILVRTSGMQVCWCGFSITNSMKYVIFQKVLWIKTYQVALGESSDASGIHYMMNVLTVTDPVRKHSAKRWFSLKLLSFFSPKKQLTSESKLMGLEKHRGSKDERRISKLGTENKYVEVKTTKGIFTFSSYYWGSNILILPTSFILPASVGHNCTATIHKHVLGIVCKNVQLHVYTAWDSSSSQYWRKYSWACICHLL